MLTPILAAISVGLSIALCAAIVRLSRATKLGRRYETCAGRARELADRLAEPPDALLVVNRDGHRVHIGGDESPARESVFDRLPVEIREDFGERLRDAFEQEQVEKFEFERHGDPCVIEIRPVRLEAAGQSVAIVQFHDHTESTAMIERVRRLAERNEAILRSSMDGFFVVSEDYRFIEVNGAFCRMTGYSPRELLGMRISDLEVDDEFDGGVPSHTRTGLHQFPTAHRRKDGGIVYLEDSINVIHDNNRKILVGFARDVTERRRADAEMAALYRRHRLILDSAMEGICGIDRNGCTMFANPAAAAMLGAHNGSLIGRSIHDVLFAGGKTSNDDHEASCIVCSALARGAACFEPDAVFHRTDGETISVEYSVNPIIEDGDVSGAVVVFRDTTERKRAEEEKRALETQVRQIQKLDSLGVLAGGIAHDLNNMLVGVLGNACLASEELPDRVTVRGRLRRIIASCERASKVISQILAYSGREIRETSPIDLSELVDDVIGIMRDSFPDSLEIVTDAPPDLPYVEADCGQLQQVLTNLLVNASEAIGDNPGRIRFATSTINLNEEQARRLYPGQELDAGEYVQLSVEDTGCGISPERMTRIFEPFFSEKGTGRGLGLAAMHGIVRAHGGGIRVQSRVNVGTTFTAVFPATPRDSVQLTPAVTPPTLRRGATVLVVDDEVDVREVVADILTSRGVSVLAAEDGRRAVEIFAENAAKIDVVLLDLTMPGMNGDEVFRELKRIRPDAKIIIASGYSEQSIGSRLGGMTPDAFMPKPFTLDRLVERISAVMDDGGPMDSADTPVAVC